MVNLDIDIELLTKYAHLLTQSQSVSTSQETQEKNGTEGTKFYEQKGYNAKNLVEDLDLRDPKNRYAIIKLMKQSEILALVPLLEKKAMLTGMKFFTKDKLSIILSYLPEEMLAQVIQTMYNPKEIMELMPVQIIRKFLTNSKIDQKNIFKYMDEQMKPQELKEMYREATGKDIGTENKEEMIAKLGMLNPMLFNDALQSMNPKHTKGMAAFILKEQPELLQEFSGTQLSICFDKSMKSEIIDGMEALEPDVLVKILENLPPQLLEQVVTQINPEVFADKLLTDMTAVLEKIA